MNINRRLLGCIMAPLFLCLIALGAGVPSLKGSHSPKPRPRAIIDNSFKNSQVSIIKQTAVAVELCGDQPSLPSPREYRTPFQQEAYSFSSTSSPQRDARAPPRTC